jgi:hypothetical protein
VVFFCLSGGKKIKFGFLSPSSYLLRAKPEVLKTSNIILVGAGAGLFYLLINRKSSPAPLGLTVLLTGITFPNGTITATFSVQNTGSTTAVVSAATGRLFMNGNELGPLTGFTPFTYAGPNTGLFTMAVSVSALNAVIEVSDLVLGQTGTPVVFHAVGELTVNDKQVPLDCIHQIL